MKEFGVLRGACESALVENGGWSKLVVTRINISGVSGLIWRRETVPVASAYDQEESIERRADDFLKNFSSKKLLLEKADPAGEYSLDWHGNHSYQSEH